MSEGTRSAMRINESLTGDPYLLHRIDASQLQTPVFVVHGRIEEPEEYEDEDRAMDMLVGVLLTAILAVILCGIAVVGGVL